MIERRLYSYVGDELELGAAEGGVQIHGLHDLRGFLAEHSEDIEEPFTFVVVDGVLRLAVRRSEHASCAARAAVSAAGEMRFERVDGAWTVVDATNQSTGYCPEPETWAAVADALDTACIARPDFYTTAFDFRRCPSCGERNLIKDEYFYCAACDAQLPAEWNLDDEG